MNRLSLLLALSLACLVPACSPPDPKCPPGYEDLTTWHLTVPEPGTTIDLDEACPSHAVIVLGTKQAAYIEELLPVAVGQGVNLKAELTTTCPAGEGQGLMVLGINEDGAGVSSQTAAIGQQTLRASWTAKADRLGLVIGAQTNRPPCEVGARIVLSTKK